MSQIPSTSGACPVSSYTQNSMWDNSVSAQTMQLNETSYDHLIPLALQPLTVSSKEYINEKAVHPGVYKNTEYGSFCCSLSPAELLDRHIQMGSEAHLTQLCSIPLTSTKNADWTHFGGKPPPDEIAMSQTQVQLLHNQVMFERHRRETHAERNRRLLGKAKRSQIHEENTATLKDQVYLLEKKMDNIKKELKAQINLYQQLENKKKQAEKEFNITLGKLIQEKSSLQYSNKKLQGLLVTQKQENDMLKEETQLSRSHIVDMLFELELLRTEVDRFRKMEKELQWLAKENVLLQEMNQQYKEKLEFAEQPRLPDIELELMKVAECSEIKNMKQMLDSKTMLIDALKGKVASLDDELSVAKKKLTDQSEVNEYIKAIHKDEIKAREDRLSELQKIHHHHTAVILELHQSKEKLICDIENLKRKNKSSAGAIFSSNVQPFIASADNGDFSHDLPSANANNNGFVVPADKHVFNLKSDSTNGSGNLDSI